MAYANMSENMPRRERLKKIKTQASLCWNYDVDFSVRKNMSQQKWRINIQNSEVEAEESHKKSQDHFNSMPQSLPTRNWKSSKSAIIPNISQFAF